MNHSNIVDPNPGASSRLAAFAAIVRRAERMTLGRGKGRWRRGTAVALRSPSTSTSPRGAPSSLAPTRFAPSVTMMIGALGIGTLLGCAPSTAPLDTAESGGFDGAPPPSSPADAFAEDASAPDTSTPGTRLNLQSPCDPVLAPRGSCSWVDAPFPRTGGEIPDGTYDLVAVDVTPAPSPSAVCRMTAVLVLDRGHYQWSVDYSNARGHAGGRFKIDGAEHRIELEETCRQEPMRLLQWHSYAWDPVARELTIAVPNPGPGGTIEIFRRRE